MNNNLKILHIIPNLGKGGAERLVVDICNELNTRENIDYRLVTFETINDYLFLTENIKLVFCPINVELSVYKKNKIDINSLEKLILDFQPHIIHSHIFYADIVSRLNLYPNIKYFSHIHGRTAQYERIKFSEIFNKRRLTDFYERIFVFNQYRKSINHFIAVSKDTETYLKMHLPKHLQKITVLPNAIDFNRFYRGKTEYKSETINLLNIGRLDDNKNQSFLIDVVKNIANKGFPVHLDILGNGNNREKLQQKINDYQLSDKIILRGNVDDTEHFLHHSYLYLFSSLKESFGLTILEAMASGLPVVALDAGGNRDIIIDGHNGFILKKVDVNLFAEKIIQLIEDKNLYQQMSVNSIDFARKYDIKEYVDKLLDFYKSILLRN